MPEPVFRTSAGRTPKSGRNYTDADEIDTLAPDSDEVDQDEIDTEIPNIANADDVDTLSLDAEETLDGSAGDVDLSEAVTEENPLPKAATKTKPASGCANTILTIIGVVGFFALTFLLIAVYFLFFYVPAESGTFNAFV